MKKFYLPPFLARTSAIELAKLISWQKTTSRWEDSSLISLKWNWNLQGLETHIAAFAESLSTINSQNAFIPTHLYIAIDQISLNQSAAFCDQLLKNRMEFIMCD